VQLLGVKEERDRVLDENIIPGEFDVIVATYEG
jgi:hypothetical protein